MIGGVRIDLFDVRFACPCNALLRHFLLACAALGMPLITFDL